MTHWAKTGVKCVCVGHFGGSASWYIPKFRHTYTVASVEHGHSFGTAIELLEIGADIARYKFDARSFRPLITRTQEQDMELFTPLLDVHHHKELEREFQ